MDAPLYDILDETRPWNGGYEIGCYELAYTSIAEEEAQAVVWTSIGANDMVKLIDTNGNLVYEVSEDISLPSLADGLYIFLECSNQARWSPVNGFTSIRSNNAILQEGLKTTST